MTKAVAKINVTMHKDKTGFDDMARTVEGNAGHAARTWAADVKNGAKAKAPVRTGYLKESIASTRTGRKVWKVEVGAHYGIYVEYGTRYMAAQPYFRPAIQVANKNFRRNMRKVLQGKGGPPIV